MSQPELPPLGHAVAGAIGASLSNTIVYPVLILHEFPHASLT